ncbi:hypothetical protein HWV62_13251 [Athelia sp. TMB]|nr:hypothetical protein HWV62_13251 [Athelia sp. TMB]
MADYCIPPLTIMYRTLNERGNSNEVSTSLLPIPISGRKKASRWRKRLTAMVVFNSDNLNASGQSVITNVYGDLLRNIRTDKQGINDKIATDRDRSSHLTARHYALSVNESSLQSELSTHQTISLSSERHHANGSIRTTSRLRQSATGGNTSAQGSAAGTNGPAAPADPPSEEAEDAEEDAEEEVQDNAPPGTESAPSIAAPDDTEDSDSSSSNDSSMGSVFPSIPKDYLKDDLVALSDPIQIDISKLDKGASMTDFSTTKIPGLRGQWGFDGADSFPQLSRINQALIFTKEFRSASDDTLKELSRSNKRKDSVRNAIKIVDGAFLIFTVIHKDASIIAARPRSSMISQVSSYLGRLRDKVKNSIISKGGILPDVPLWAYDNDYNRWWCLNDFEIHATRWRKDADELLLALAPYLPSDKPAAGEVISPGTVTDQTFDQRSTPYDPFPIYNPAFEPTSISNRLETDRVARFNPATPQQYSHPGSSTVIRSLMNGESHVPTSYQFQQSVSHDPFNSHNAQPSPRTPVPNRRQREAPGAPDNDPNGSDSDGPSRGPGRNPRPPIPPRSARRPTIPSGSTAPTSAPRGYHFDLKLKPESIPEWDGNEDKLARWIDKVNSIAKRSVDVHRELGAIVPRRLTSAAETWYYSIPSEHREYMEESWSTLRTAIGNYWMNHQWLERQKIRATTTRFRDSGNSRETPSEYVVRKLDLIRLVFNFTDTECIQMIMNEAPSSWSPIIQPLSCKNIVEFINTVKYHETNLSDVSASYGSSYAPRNTYNSNRQNYQRNARVNLVGWSKNISPPQFPKDDRNVSKKTPESIGARPCRHCGSGMHWDKECKHAKQGEKQARANFVATDDQDQMAQEEYDNLYYSTDSEDQQDF